MKITVFFTFDVSLKDWFHSGLFSREISLYKKLIDLGHTVQFLTYGDESDLLYENYLKGIKLIPVYTRLWRSDIRFFRIVTSFLIPILFKNELMFCNIYKANQIIGAWVAVLSKFLYKTPIVQRCGYEPLKNSIINRDKLSRKIFLYLTSFPSYYYSDKIIVTTLDIKEFIIDNYSIRRNKFVTIGNSIDTNMFCPKIINKDIDILYVGRLSSEKNLELLLRGVKGTNLNVSIIGDGPEYNKLHALTNLYNLDVTFHGVIQNDLLPSYYQRSKIFILCSNYEGNPKAMLEAMSCGCPVIGTNIPGIHNLIDSSNGYLIDSNCMSLKSILLKISNDEKLLSFLGRNSRKKVSKNYSLSINLKKELSLYSNILG